LPKKDLFTRAFKNTVATLLKGAKDEVKEKTNRLRMTTQKEKEQKHDRDVSTCD
jgi:hypothetical protein